MATMTLSEQIQAMIAEQKELKAAAKRVASDLKKCKRVTNFLKGFLKIEKTEVVRYNLLVIIVLPTSSYYYSCVIMSLF